MMHCNQKEHYIMIHFRIMEREGRGINGPLGTVFPNRRSKSVFHLAEDAS